MTLLTCDSWVNRDPGGVFQDFHEGLRSLVLWLDHAESSLVHPDASPRALRVSTGPVMGPGAFTSRSHRRRVLFVCLFAGPARGAASEGGSADLPPAAVVPPPARGRHAGRQRDPGGDPGGGGPAEAAAAAGGRPPRHPAAPSGESTAANSCI